MFVVCENDDYWASLDVSQGDSGLRRHHVNLPSGTWVFLDLAMLLRPCFFGVDTDLFIHNLAIVGLEPCLAVLKVPALRSALLSQRKDKPE